MPLLWILAFPGLSDPVLGQEAPSLGPDGGVAAQAEPTLHLTRVAGETRLTGGGTLALRLNSFVWVGGGGYSLLRPIELAPPQAGSDTELSFGYGGLSLGFERHGGDRNLLFGVGVLLGAGAARVRNRQTNATLGSANLLVAAPYGQIRLAPMEALHLGVKVGFRATSSASGLPGVAGRAFNGPTFGLFLRFTRAP